MSSKTLGDEILSPDESQFEGGTGRFRFGLRQLLFLIFYCALAFWAMTIVAIPIVVGSLLMIGAAGVMVAILVLRRRSTQQDMLVSILAVAAERDMPLAPALDAISDQFAGEYRRKVRALAHYLKAGVSLPEALDREPRTLPGETEILARVGSEVGMLAGALREAGATRNGLKPVWRGIAIRLGYFLYVLYVLQVINGFLFYFILPKYQAILRDFGISPPSLTRSLMQIGDAVQQWAGLYGLVLLVEMAAFLALLGSFTGWSRLKLPGSDRLLVSRHSALILRALAWVVEGGYPIPRGLELLVGWYPSPWVQTRLRRVIQDVQHGSDWVDSLVHHGLLRKVDAAVLESAMRAGNLPWALRETAMSGERRLAYRLQGFLQVLTPIVLITLGLIVGLVCVAYFAPLITILEVLA